MQQKSKAKRDQAIHTSSGFHAVQQISHKFVDELLAGDLLSNYLITFPQQISHLI